MTGTCSQFSCGERAIYEWRIGPLDRTSSREPHCPASSSRLLLHSSFFYRSRRALLLGLGDFSVQFSQLLLSTFQRSLALHRHVLAGAIHIERQHRHCRLIRLCFATLASLGRSFERARDTARIAARENTILEREGITRLCDTTGPALLLHRHGTRSTACLALNALNPLSVPDANSLLKAHTDPCMLGFRFMRRRSMQTLKSAQNEPVDYSTSN
jgi:hypothetical protein